MPKIIPALLASTALLAPSILHAEASSFAPIVEERAAQASEQVSSPSESLAEQGAGPLLLRLTSGLDDLEMPLDQVILGQADIAPGKETYSSVMLHGMVIETLTIEGKAIGPLSLSIQNAMDMQGLTKLGTLRLDFDPALISQITMTPSLDALEDDRLQELCAGLANGLTGSLWGLQSKPSADSDNFLKIASLEFSGKATPAGDSCVGDFWGYINDFDLHLESANGAPSKVKLDSLDFKMKRLIDRDLPTEDLGVSLSDQHKIAGLRVTFNGIEDALTMSSASITSQYHSDDLSALGRAGANQLASHTPLASGAEAPAEIDMGKLWNIVRETSGSAALEIEQLDVKASALGGMPAAILGMKGIENLSFTGDMNLHKTDGNLAYGMFHTLDPLLSFGIEAKLQLDEAPEGVMSEPAQFVPPVSLKTAHLLLDDRGADDLVRSLTGSGIVDLLSGQIAWMPEDQKAVVIDWIGSSIGVGQTAKLRLAPDAPVAIEDLAPMLMGDWAVLGTTLNASTLR